ncbi:RNA polymerase sigma factor SigM [Pseudonocardia sp. GCM10023141]|uniref:RNA polymerase sigma factor SigM n=1 Tax=Pseudonocardia sp. GCM10023141 TaxID=3252653 RepID=UPI00360E0B74
MLPAAPTDEELLAAHRAGDPEAFGLIACRHAEGMWGVAVRTLHHHEDAADAVQEALISAMRRASTYRGEAPVRTWLYRIVVNACIDRIRVERRRPTVPLFDTDTPAGRSDPATELATRMAVGDALTALPEEQRMAVVLVDVQGWSVAEAAEIMAVPIGTVKSRCARGRLRLAALLGHLREEQ